MNNWLLNLVQGTNYTAGHQIVSPSFHLNPALLSEEARESAHLFATRMLSDRYHDDHTPIDIPNHFGATEKLHFTVGGHQDENGKLLPSSTFMVKPYYENLAHWQWGHYPLSGWAEMAYHGILNASGLGHMAMNVHAFPYTKSTLLAIDLAHDMHPIGSYLKGTPWRPGNWSGGYGEVEISPHVKDDAAKLGALDFLLGNQDRNDANLLMHVSPQNQVGTILAIDNGRSMQYMGASRARAPFENLDNPLYYMTVSAFKDLVGRRRFDGGQYRFSDLQPSLRAVSAWWKEHRRNVADAFDLHSGAIKYLPMLSHIRSSFKDRFGAMDAFVDHIDKFGAKPFEAYLSGDVDGHNKKVFHSGTVKVRSWKPPQPELVSPEFETGEDELERTQQGPPACPLCGEEWKTDANHHH